GTRPAPPMNPWMPTLPQALGMAEGFLLGDPTCRESWEMHREGMLGRPEVASRFPVGLILEVLCRRGLRVQGAIDEFLDFTVANGFRYYDHPRSGVDSDTVGVFLRLRQYATASVYDHVATDVLACLERHVRATGAIPVWLTGCVGDEESESTVIALGEGCGTVAAHLLLGLLAADDEQAESVTIGAQSLLDRIGSVGLAANLNYPPLFALGTWFRFLTLLGARDDPVAVRGIEAARSVLTDALTQAVSRTRATAQDAALLTLACHDANRQDLIDPGWLVQVLKRQRFDGNWIGEAFVAAPNRGRSVSWYSSTLLTTALCYDALARQGKRLAAGTD